MRHETEGAKLVAVVRLSLSHGLSHGCEVKNSLLGMGFYW